MITIGKKKEAVWCERTYNGSKIKLLICPVTESRMSEIRQANTSKIAVLNTGTGAMELVPDLDTVANAKALADEIIQGAEGFVDDNDKPLELTVDTKYEIYLLKKLEGDAQPLWQWILEQAGALQAKKDEEKADDAKNS